MMKQSFKLFLTFLLFVDHSLGKRTFDNVDNDEIKVPSKDPDIPEAIMKDIFSTPKFRKWEMYASDDSDIRPDTLSGSGKMLKVGSEHETQFNPTDNRILFPGTLMEWQESQPISFKKRQTSKNLTQESNKDAMSRTLNGSMMGVTHSEIAVRSSPPAAVCKSKSGVGGANVGQGNGAGDEKLTAVDRVLKNYSMTQSLMYANCGKSPPTGTVCFGTPSGCVEEKACRLIVNFGYDKTNPDYISINFVGETSNSGYIAFAFSQDRFMGSDLLVYCINAEKLPKNVTDPAVVGLYLAVTDSHQSVEIQKSRKYYENNFCPRFGYQENEMLGCSFDLAAKVSLDDGSQMDIKNNPLYLILTFGHFIDSLAINDLNYGSIANQHLVEFSSEPIVLRNALLKPKIIYPRSRALILLHAISAVIAFIFLIPSGIFIAKYGREVNGYNTDACGKYSMPAWLRNHILIAVVSVPFVLTSLIAILLELDFTWRSVSTIPFLHSIAGVFAYFLILLNITGGCFFKIQKYADYTNNDVNEGNLKESSEKGLKLSSVIMTWAHWLVGNMSYLCAVFCVCVAASLPRAQAPCVVEYFAYLHLSLFLLAHLFITFNTKRLAKIIGDDRSVVHYRAIIGPITTWRMKDISKLDSAHEFHKMDIWKIRKQGILFILFTSFIIAFTISVLMNLPIVLCK